MKLQRIMGLTLAAAATSFALTGNTQAQAEEFQVTDNWVMEITPALKISREAQDVSEGVPASEDAVPSESAVSTSVDPRAYARVYQSIPFNRAEFNSNPTYRHDAAMEILTGNARHQTIVQHTTERPDPVLQNPPFALPYRYNNPAQGLNYYFYFPYWNFRGYY